MIYKIIDLEEDDDEDKNDDYFQFEILKYD